MNSKMSFDHLLEEEDFGGMLAKIPRSDEVKFGSSWKLVVSNGMNDSMKIDGLPLKNLVTFD